MAHGITSKDQMAYCGSVPWHNLGVKFEGEGLMTAEKAVQLAQLGWTVTTIPLKGHHPDGSVYETSGVAVLRDDTKEVLGIVTEDYEPIQNAQLFSFFDHLVEDGKGFVETAGSLFGGKKVWVLAKLDGLLEFKHGKYEEVYNRYVFLLSRHDGMGSLTGLVTPVRVVCNNTVMAALGNCSNKVVIYHTKNAQERIKEAKRLMEISTKYYEEFGKMAEFLSGKEIKVGRQLVDYFEHVFPMPPPKKDENGNFVPPDSRTVKAQRAKALEVFMEEEDRYGADWLSALNAATGVTSHFMKYRNDELKMDNLLSGKGYDYSKRAVELALKG